MLAIRLQRTGRSGHAQFRVIVQDSRFSPKRGRIVAYLGSYNPHTKTAVIDSQKAAQYLENGAQPSDRVARLLQKEGIKLPNWVKLDEPRQRSVRHPEKRRSTHPTEPEAPTTEAAAPASEEATAEATPEESTSTEGAQPAPESEAPTEESTAENPPADQAPAEAEQ